MTSTPPHDSTTKVPFSQSSTEDASPSQDPEEILGLAQSREIEELLENVETPGRLSRLIRIVEDPANPIHIRTDAVGSIPDVADSQSEAVLALRRIWHSAKEEEDIRIAATAVLGGISEPTGDILIGLIAAYEIDPSPAVRYLAKHSLRRHSGNCTAQSSFSAGDGLINLMFAPFQKTNNFSSSEQSDTDRKMADESNHQENPSAEIVEDKVPEDLRAAQVVYESEMARFEDSQAKLREQAKESVERLKPHLPALLRANWRGDPSDVKDFSGSLNALVDMAEGVFRVQGREGTFYLQTATTTKREHGRLRLMSTTVLNGRRLTLSIRPECTKSNQVAPADVLIVCHSLQDATQTSSQQL